MEESARGCAAMEWATYEIETPGLVQAGEWRTLAEAHEHALVILAAGIDCSVHPLEDGYEVLTEVTDAATARRELALYTAEQAARPRRPMMAEAPDHPPGIPWMLAWAVILAVTYYFQGTGPGFTERFANSSAGVTADGEWWRPFTALFLHGDPIHLLGNVTIGGVFCLLAAKSIGAWRAWLLILSAGTAGNWVNALQHRGDTFYSIGASTATFGALGLLVGLAIAGSVRTHSGERLRALAVPFLAGVVLFSLFGASGENTDIGGHAWGGVCGLVAGGIAGWLRLGESAPPVEKRSPLRLAGG